MACLGERSLSSGVLLQTALIKDCNTHHVTVGAYEKILELISFTDHQDTHLPSFLLQGRDAAPTAPLPHSVSLRSTQMNVYAHARTQ